MANKTSFKKGNIPWNKGLTKEDSRVRANIDKAMKVRLKNGNFRKPGEYTHSEETRKKIGLSGLGRKCPQWKKEYLSKLYKGRKVSDEQKKKISEALKGHAPFYRPPTGKDHWFYTGGRKHNNLTDRQWNKIRETILERDDNKCQLCFKQLTTILRNDGLVLPNLHVHHLDWNKKNNSHENLVTLCVSCHTKMHAHKIQDIKFDCEKITKKLI